MAKLFRFDFASVTQPPADHYVLNPGVLARGLLTRKLLILDIEATGLDVTREEITEIAVQEYNPTSERAGEHWQTFVRVERDIPPEISRLTSITREQTDSGLPIHEALSYLAHRYPNHIWVAQCGFEFDFPFLERVYFEAGLPTVEIDTLDPKILFSVLHPHLRDTFSTNYLAAHFGVDRSRFQRHTAAGDVALIVEIMAGIIREAKEQGLTDVTIANSTIIRKFIPQPLP